MLTWFKQGTIALWAWYTVKQEEIVSVVWPKVLGFLECSKDVLCEFFNA